jgi:hypothetical protein
MATDYQKDLKQAQQELADLLASREQTEIEIARQKRKIAALIELCREDDDFTDSTPLDLGGLTEACTTVLRGARKNWMNIAEIQLALTELGFPIRNYKAPVASISTTVNRLVEDGVVVADKRFGPGATEYKWVGKVPTLGDYTTAGKMLNELTTARDRFVQADKAKVAREEARKKAFPLQLGHPDPLNQRGKK